VFDWWCLIGVWTERCDKLVHITSIIAKALSKPLGTFVASGIVEKQRQNDSCPNANSILKWQEPNGF
jgi:hypothetical protein